MLADRVRMGKAKNSGIEVTLHFNSGFLEADIFVGDGTVDQIGIPAYRSPENLIWTAIGGETVTFMVEKGSYISIFYDSMYFIERSFYYTSLDSTIKNLGFAGGNIHITEIVDIYYNSVDDM